MLTSGDVVLVDLGVPVGREAGFPRLVVVLTAQRVLDHGPSVVQAVPLTTTLRGWESEVVIEPDDLNGLDRRSAAQCQHLRAVATARLGARRGSIGAARLAAVRDTVGLLLDLPS
ncbi:MAG TPA: type II toxin-antitoxin system PemK/MazF family toxin [Nocardioides sp.]